MTDSTGTTNYTYNCFGELTGEQKGNILKTYSYNYLGKVTSFKLNNGSNETLSQTYSYDSLGRLLRQWGRTFFGTIFDVICLLTNKTTFSKAETNLIFAKNPLLIKRIFCI